MAWKYEQLICFGVEGMSMTAALFDSKPIAKKEFFHFLLARGPIERKAHLPFN